MTLTIRTPRLKLTEEAYYYHQRPCLCARTLRKLFYLPRKPHFIWLTISTDPHPESHIVYLCAVKWWFGPGYHFWWSRRRSCARKTIDHLFMSRATRWLNRHFSAILEDGKPHKFYVSVEYQEEAQP